MQKKVLVLGGTGTIGHQLCKRLKGEGYFVRCVDRKHPEFSKSSADELIIGDLREKKFVEEVMQIDGGWDMCFALMAEMGGSLYVFSQENDAEIIHNSALMNLHVADSAARNNVIKIFFASSACCYCEELQAMEDSNALKEITAWQCKPDSIYGIEKLFSEQVYFSFFKNKGLNVRIGRFHNVFSEEGCYKGGREKFPAAVCRKVAEARDGDSIEIFGDGKQQRSYLYIDEALEGMIKLMDSDYALAVNIGSDESISVNDLARMVIGFSGKNITIKNVPSNFTGVRSRNSDNELIQEVLNWRPTQKLEIGMKKLFDWVNWQVNGNV